MTRYGSTKHHRPAAWRFIVQATAACLLAAVLAQLANPAEARAAAWTPLATTIAGPPLDAVGTDIATNSAGDTAAVWATLVGGERRIQASTRPRDSRSWTDPQYVSSAGADADDPHVVVDDSGVAHVVWHQFDGVNTRVHARHSVGMLGQWAPGYTLSPLGQDAGNSEVTIDPSGTVHAVWENGSVLGIQYSQRNPATGVWDPIQNVTPLGTSVFDPKLGVDANGTVTAVWVRSSGGTRVQTAARPAVTDTWFAAGFLSSADYAASAPDVAVSPNGTAHAIWLQDIAGKDVAFAASRVNGAWGATQQASAQGQDAAGPTIIVDSKGIKHAAWSRRDANGHFIVQSVHAADPTGDFVITANLSAAGEHALAARLAAGPKGLIAASWIRDSGGAKLVEARTTRDPIVGWGSTTTISTPALIAAQHALAIDGSDNVTAAWIVSNGANDIARVRVFDSSPPVVLNMRTQATAVVGESVTLKADISDSYSSIAAADMLWNPGDGSQPLVGPNAQHVFQAPGVYTIKLILTDAALNSSTTEAQITVTAAAPPAARPRATTPPQLVGTSRVGRRLTCNRGVWSGTPSPTFSFVWQRDTSRGWRPIRGATRQRYRAAQADRRKRVRCIVTATNSEGSAAAATRPVRVTRRR